MCVCLVSVLSVLSVCLVCVPSVCVCLECMCVYVCALVRMRARVRGGLTCKRRRSRRHCVPVWRSTLPGKRRPRRLWCMAARARRSERLVRFVDDCAGRAVFRDIEKAGELGLGVG